MAIKSLIVLLSALKLSAALCPFKRGDSGAFDLPEDKVAEIIARVNEHVTPEEAPKQKRASFDPESQLIDVSGDHAWQAPGPHDM